LSFCPAGRFPLGFKMRPSREASASKSPLALAAIIKTRANAISCQPPTFASPAIWNALPLASGRRLPQSTRVNMHVTLLAQHWPSSASYSDEPRSGGNRHTYLQECSESLGVKFGLIRALEDSAMKLVAERTLYTRTKLRLGASRIIGLGSLTFSRLGSSPNVIGL